MQYLIYFICSIITISCFAEDYTKDRLILSSPEQLATLSCESEYLVGGIICPSTGLPVLRQTDLTVKGVQSIDLTRIYLSPTIPYTFPLYKHSQQEYNKKHLLLSLEDYKGWNFFPHLKLIFNSSLKQVRLSDPNGATYDFDVSTTKTTLASPADAITNTSGNEPSGKYDVRNTKIVMNGNEIIVYASDCTIRHYRKNGFATPMDYLFLLEKEIFPHGKVLKYFYNKRQLSRIDSMDTQERHVYASLNVTGDPMIGYCHFTATTGVHAEYTYQRDPVHIKIKNKGLSEELNLFFPPYLIAVSSPNYRNEMIKYTDLFLLSSYAGKEHTFSCIHAGFENFTKVQKLSAPVGPENSFQSIYEINYKPPTARKTGSTEITAYDGTFIIYNFSKNYLLKSIQYFSVDKILQKEKILTWTANNWLESIEMRDKDAHILYTKSYEYDCFGNPIVEKFTGNLRGKGDQETFTIAKEYSQDSLNLLLREEYENGKVVNYTYLAGTNRINSKLTKDHETIILREYFVYDDACNLTQKISDDGNSFDADNFSQVTQRLITSYTLRQQQPFLHIPEWIEEKYLENGVEKLLCAKHLIHDQFGNIAQEEIYDANKELSYTLYKEYNERGDVISETNAFGDKAEYAYDEKGQRIQATSNSGRVQTTMLYDAVGRLREREEGGDDGLTHSFHYEYDFLDRLIKKADPFSNEIKYAYDPLVNKVAKTEFPNIGTSNGGSIAVTTISTYDPFGRELTSTDQNSNITNYCYNAYGSNTQVTRPDGSVQVFLYNKDGSLKSATNEDGLTITYIRDVLGRIVLQSYSMPDGTILAEESFSYTGFNLLSSTDKEGNITKYEYDGAGRMTRENSSGRIIDFGYNALGHLCKETKYVQDDALVIHYNRDFDDRILEITKTDLSGRLLYKINYSYDKDSNTESIARHINGNQAIETFTYDSFGRLLAYRDANGEFISKSYHESYCNALGQNVLQIIQINPKGIKNILTQDAFGRTAAMECFDTKSDTVLSRSEMFYDAYGNLTEDIEYIYSNGQYLDRQAIKYTYNSINHQEQVIRAADTKNARSTSFTYLPSGKLSTKTLPSDQTLTYAYDPLGYLQELLSSDGSIHHRFKHDKLGRLKYAADVNANIVVNRQLDSFGNVLSEILPSGAVISSKYDALDRLAQLTIGDYGQVTYCYDPLHLRNVQRISKGGDLLYSHSYDAYDLDGNLIEENMNGNLGSITHSHDLLQRETQRSSPFFTQKCTYDSIGNLITSTVDGNCSFYDYDGLSQLAKENIGEQCSNYVHDSIYNCIQKNESLQQLNDLNEFQSSAKISCAYDLNGNLLQKQTSSGIFNFKYDLLNQLVEASSDTVRVSFAYDPLGRRAKRTSYVKDDQMWTEKEKETYLYQGENEIAAVTKQGSLANLKVLGREAAPQTSATVAIETGEQVYTAINDIHGNIRRLIHCDSSEIADKYDYSAFGEELHEDYIHTSANPWKYASQRIEPEFGLIYFGKRYYDPEVARWLSVDPADFLDSKNLYQYVLNNPFRYADPRGENLFGFVCGVAQIIAGSAIMATGVALEIGTCGGYTFALGFHESIGLAMVGSGCTQAAYHAQDINLSKSRSSRPNPDLRAGGSPHTIVERPGHYGQYTTHNGDGTYKQYRGAGQSHGEEERPNIKETKINQSPKGPTPGRPNVRKPTPDEIPKN